MKNAGCTGNVFPVQAGGPVAVTANYKMTSKMRIIITLMALVAVLIVAIAIYVFTHLSAGISASQGIILVAIAVAGLFIIMGVIFMLFRSIIARK